MNKTPYNFWAFSAPIPSLPPYQGAEFSYRSRHEARNIGPLGRCKRLVPWPAPALSGAGIYLHDTCCQKKSHIGTFSAPIPVTSLFIRGLATLEFTARNHWRRIWAKKKQNPMRED
jgi:hypothetical protein